MACPPSTCRLLVWSAVLCSSDALDCRWNESMRRHRAFRAKPLAPPAWGTPSRRRQTTLLRSHDNPAGMTQLRGVHILTGALFVGGTTNFTSSSTGQNYHWRPRRQPWRGLLLLICIMVANLKDIGFDALEKWTAGVGATAPIWFTDQVPRGINPFSTAVYFNTNPLLDIKPTVAYKLNDYLSFGLGADIYTYSALFGEGQVEVMSTGANNGLGPQFESQRQRDWDGRIQRESVVHGLFGMPTGCQSPTSDSSTGARRLCHWPGSSP